MSKKDNFSDNINELNKLYVESPEIVSEELNNLVIKLRRKEQNKLNILQDMDLEILFTVLIQIAYLLVGLFNINSFLLYLGGFIFLAAGLMVGLHVKGFGLIFLFSHGATGVGVMCGSILYKALSSPILTDGANLSVKTYLIINLIIIILGFILAVIYNLSDNVKRIKYAKLIPMIVVLIGLIMVNIFPYFFNYLYL